MTDMLAKYEPEPVFSSWLIKKRKKKRGFCKSQGYDELLLDKRDENSKTQLLLQSHFYTFKIYNQKIT